MASKYGDGNFSVQIRSRELVTAAIPLPESWLPLSNLDLAVAAAYPNYFFVYTKPHCDLASMISTLKKALSKLLATFYPLAGVMVTNPVGETLQSPWNRIH
ncbi:hypothetical protein EJ110_NYTH30578 [Nymphaea thermarum]|nr:hypothetical protein EJ110_NYTH30578 [Nymphaea thermarum]